jgi:hypothetical protein
MGDNVEACKYGGALCSDCDNAGNDPDDEDYYYDYDYDYDYDCDNGSDYDYGSKFNGDGDDYYYCEDGVCEKCDICDDDKKW